MLDKGYIVLGDDCKVAVGVSGRKSWYSKPRICPGGHTAPFIDYFEVQGRLVSVMLAISQWPSRLTRLKIFVPQWSGLPLRIAS
jgi:hypothetical protein